MLVPDTLITGLRVRVPAKSLRIPGWLFSSAIIALKVAQNFLPEGLFGDGICYAAISRNEAVGQGTFWAPFYATSYWLPHNPDMSAFYEHPPLMFGIQSIFFRLLGDTIWTEKIYSAVILLLTAVVIVQLWKQLLPAGHSLRSWGWFPLLIWYSFPLVAWGMAQNFLDATMILFCLLSVWFILLGIMAQQTSRAWLFGVGAVISLIAAFFTKGPVSLHVFAVPVVYGLLAVQSRPYRMMVQWTLGLTLGFTALMGCILLYGPAWQNFSAYIDQQIWAALTNKRETTGRFDVLKVFYNNGWPLALITAGFYGLRRWLKLDASNVGLSVRVGWFWFGIGLCVLLPMMISKKQFDHYLMPVLPYVSLGLSYWLLMNILPVLQRFAYWSYYRWILLLGGGLIWINAIVTSWETAGKMKPEERVFLEDIHAVGKWVPNQSRLGVFPDLMGNFPLHPYLQRYFRIDMTEIDKRPLYAMMNPTNQQHHADSLLAKGYKPVNTAMNLFVLYKRQD